MRHRNRLATFALATLATLPCTFTASGQSDPQRQVAEQQRLEAERQKLEAERQQLEQQRQRLDMELQRAKEAAGRIKEQAQQAGRRAKEEAERVARRAKDEVQRQYQRAYRLAQIPEKSGQHPGGFRGGPGAGGELSGPPSGFGKPPSDFERELFRAQGLDAGPGAGGAASAFLGVTTTPAPASVRKRIELPDGIGLVVSGVEPGSPAEAAGLKQYDILHKLNDQLLVNVEQLLVLVRTFKPGEEVRLTIVRGGQPQELRARLGERRQTPQPPQPGKPVPFGQGPDFHFAPGAPAQPWQPVKPGQPPQPKERFWMPNPLRSPAAVRPSKPVLPPGATPGPEFFYTPVPEPVPVPAPTPTPELQHTPPQIHVVPMPRPTAPILVPAIPAAPAPAPESALLLPAPAQP